MRKLLLGLLFTIQLLPFTLYAQTPPSLSAADIYLGLKKLKVLGSVLYVAAHPDDENTRLLAFFSKEKLYRTGYMSMTRGDGGQNLIGDEQGVELGLIRTQELLAARRIDGAEQFFSRAFDFGFSKSTDEALKTWDKEKVLSDVVWVIRKFQPDVIITRFPEDSRAGHGHHSGSAVLAREAFVAAADANRFPEQFKYGVKPWQAKRIVWNTFNFGSANTISEDQFKMDVGVFNPVLGKSYGEIAAESRSQHKSQGFGVPRSRGQQFEYFKPTLGDTARKDLMDGVITDWNRVEGGSAINAAIDDIIKSFSFDNTSASVSALVKLYADISKMQDGYWKNKKLGEIQTLIEACAGIWMEGTTAEQYVAQGDTLKINFSINSRSSVKTFLKNYTVIDGPGSGKDLIEMNKELEPNKNFNFSKTINIDANHEISQPYWLKEEMTKGSFNVSDQLLIGKAQSDPSLSIVFNINIEGQGFSYAKPVQYKFTDPVKGELLQPLVIVPPVTVYTKPALLVIKNNSAEEYNLQSVLRGMRGINKTGAYLDLQKNGFTTQTKHLNDFSLVRGAEKNDTFLLKAPITNISTLKKILAKNNNESSVTIMNDKGELSENYRVLLRYNDTASPSLVLSQRTISFDHIPTINFFYQTKTKALYLDLKTTGKSIGYITGAGDKVPEALTQMGYIVTTIGEKDLTLDNLEKFDAVVAGVRAYNVHDYMSNAYDALMEYVKQGGVYVVQYNTNNGVGPLANGKIGPAPFMVTRNRITDEEAKVNFLQPNHPALNYPNKITEKDFEGWVQERSIYEADKADSSYASILSFKDPNENPSSGSLIVNNYGKGKFVYTGLVFFRELPAGVPGAYRLFANILAKPVGVKEKGKKGK